MIKKQFILNFLIIFFIFFLDKISKIYILNIAENTGVVDITVNSFLNLILFGIQVLDLDFSNLIRRLLII